MAIIQLTEMERRQLKEVVRSTREAKQLRRAQALLDLDGGEKVEVVAKRQGVGCSTIYDWAKRFKERRAEPITKRLRDRPRSGRPPHKRQKAKEVILSVIKTDPREFGYRYPVWTTPLLCHHIQKEHELNISARTIRRAFRDLGYRYKRPRYKLARRSPHWRQAKGGFSGV